MANAIIIIACLLFLAIILSTSDIKEIFMHRSTMAKESECERTEQKRLELETAKVNATTAKAEA